MYTQSNTNMNDTARKIISRPFQNSFTFINLTCGSYSTTYTNIEVLSHFVRFCLFLQSSSRDSSCYFGENQRKWHMASLVNQFRFDWLKKISKNVHLGPNLSVESISGVKITVAVIFVVVKINYLTLERCKSQSV